MTTQLTTRSGAPADGFPLGTMQFGGRADAAESRRMYDAAREAGLNHFDTAVRYTQGEAEMLLGGFVRPERDKIFLATKVGYAGGCGRENIRTQFDICRSQLQMDEVDLLYLHRWDGETELEETFSTLTEMQEAGQIRHIGVSNYAAWQVMKAEAVAQSLGTRIDVIQPMYNLVKRQAEVEILPMAMDQGMAVCPYSPLGGGLLTGKYAAGKTGRLTEDPMYTSRYGQDWMHKAAADFAALARKQGVAPATLAVAWVAAHPARPRPIISARSVYQLAPSLAAIGFDLTPELYARISALTPTPPLATDRLEEQ